MIPELKFGLIVQLTNGNPMSFIVPAAITLLPVLEDTFTRYALPPPRPNNITKFEGVYLASQLLGLTKANLTVKVVDTPNSSILQIIPYLSVGGGSGSGAAINATWVGANTFRLHTTQPAPCLDVQSGPNDLFIYFQTNSWTGDIYSLTMPGNCLSFSYRYFYGG